MMAKNIFCYISSKLKICRPYIAEEIIFFQVCQDVFYMLIQNVFQITTER